MFHTKKKYVLAASALILLLISIAVFPSLFQKDKEISSLNKIGETHSVYEASLSKKVKPSGSKLDAPSKKDNKEKQEDTQASKLDDSTTPFITCEFILEQINEYLNLHYKFKKFDKILSKRTLDMFFKFLDPGKLYFLESDIKKFQQLENELGKKISKKKCSFIDDINKVHSMRVTYYISEIQKLLKTDFDFNKEEYLETNRKKLTWAKTPSQLKERWRKTLKFLIINMQGVDSLDKIKKRISKRYKLLKRENEQKASDEVHGVFLNAFASALDPHSSYLMPSDKEQFKVDISLKLVGIGATLVNIDGYTTIDSIIPGGSAYKDGRLRKGDKIIAIVPTKRSGVIDIIDTPLDKVVQKIRGKENTKVTLKILRTNLDGTVKRFDITLTRKIIEIKDREARSETIVVNKKKIGVINLPSFYIDYQSCRINNELCRSSSNDLKRELLKLKKKKVDGIIIDLRRNSGGDLGECAKTIGLFINSPVIVQMEYRNNETKTLQLKDYAEPIYSGPLSVIVSRLSASASEIFAGVIKDYGRGLVIGGDHTFGKGTVQNVIDIPKTKTHENTGSIHVTIAKFYLPSGKSNQERGVPSDIIIPAITSTSEVRESEFDFPLPYTTIKKAKEFKPIEDLGILIEKLKQKSADRIKKSKEFKSLVLKIEKAKKEQNNNISLKDSALSNKIKKQRQKKHKLRGSVKKKEKTKKVKEYESLMTLDMEVIPKNDIQLKEGANILVDMMHLSKSKK